MKVARFSETRLLLVVQAISLHFMFMVFVNGIKVHLLQLISLYKMLVSVPKGNSLPWGSWIG
jgi:hypothetical protein